MGKEFYETSPIAKEIFDKASEAVELDLKALCFEENDDINITEYTQVALLTTSVAIMEVLKDRGIKPDVAAGLSLGEYCALVAANSMNYTAYAGRNFFLHINTSFTDSFCRVDICLLYTSRCV